jgi:hypothetical protein
MNYSFSCPIPCNRKIRVKAVNNIDAIDKIILAGGMGCRNVNCRSDCRQARDPMPPMGQEELRRIVGLCLKEEYESAGGN